MLLLWLVMACIPAFCLFLGAMAGDLRETLRMSYELGCSLVPWLLAFGLARSVSRRKGGDLEEGTHWVWMALFGLYVTLAFVVTGAGTLYEARYHAGAPQALAWNLSPFSQGIDPVGYLLNVLLGMPLGVLLPLLWPRWDRFGPILGAGAVFSLGIELSQLCNLRATDVDDLLMNTLGTVLGWLIFRGVAWSIHLPRGRQHPWPLGPWTTVGVLFLGRFLLFPGSWLAWQLYGA